MKKPKPVTEQKLKSIATSVWIDMQKNKCDVDVFNQDNIVYQCKKRADKLNINIGYDTIGKYLTIIKSYVNDWISVKKEQERLDAERNTNDLSELFANIETKPAYVKYKKQPTELNKAISVAVSADELIEIHLIYKSGKKEIKKIDNGVAAVNTQPVLWTGLFDYKSSGEIIIQRGGYKGINIRNLGQILDKFGTIEDFRDWCIEKIEDVDKGRIMIKSDTATDVDTLKKVIKKIDNLYANF